MSTQPKEQVDKAKQGLTQFLDALVELKRNLSKSAMEHEAQPLLKEVFKEKHQEVIPDIERLLRISMNQENYYSYSLNQAARRLRNDELHKLNRYALSATNQMRAKNSNEVFELDGENSRVHEINSITMRELAYRHQQAQKQATPNT